MDSRLHKAENQLRRIAPIVNLLLVVAIAWTAAKLFWALWPQPEGLPTLPPPRASGSGVSSAGVNINALVTAHLFGQPKTEQAVEQRPVNAPETRLNLTLKGVFHYSDERDSRAIIADDSRVERPYAVGDKIPGGAFLDSIEADRVILKRGGRFETLRLERKTSGRQSGSARSSASGTRRNISSRNVSRQAVSSAASGGGASASLAAIRSEVLNDPSRIQEYVRIQPVQNPGGDGIKGYRIYPGNNRNAFREAGLRAGEVVTSVNGVQLNDPAVALQLLGDVSQANEVTLSLERGGQSRSVTLDLSK